MREKYIYTVIVSLMLCWGIADVAAQNETIALPSKRITRKETIKQIEQQTNYLVGYSAATFNDVATLSLYKTNWSLNELLKQLTLNTGHAYRLSDGYILIYQSKQKQETTPVEVHPQPSILWTDTVDYTATLSPRNDTVKTTAYYVPANDNTIRTAANDPRTNYSLTPGQHIGSHHYMPRTAIKTNLLIWGTTTPNMAAEFALARKWTLDAHVAFNPFNWQTGSVHRFWYAQPEVRYWFCQRFEKHFVGLHGIYGQFNIGDLKLPLINTFEKHRYKGWGVGAGISYGYHLPINKRWSWEFSVGAGYVYLTYDKFRCYDCDEFVGKKARHYLGPTKAAVSLIFMLN